jgi:hypothetical protein
MQRLAVRYHSPAEGALELLKAEGTSALELMPQNQRDENAAQRIMFAMMKNGQMEDGETAKLKDKIALQKAVSEIMEDGKTGNKTTEDAKDADVDGKPERSTEEDGGKQTAKKPRMEKNGDDVTGDDTTSKLPGITFRPHPDNGRIPEADDTKPADPTLPFRPRPANTSTSSSKVRQAPTKSIGELLAKAFPTGFEDRTMAQPYIPRYTTTDMMALWQHLFDKFSFILSSRSALPATGASDVTCHIEDLFHRITCIPLTDLGPPLQALIAKLASKPATSTIVQALFSARLWGSLTAGTSPFDPEGLSASETRLWETIAEHFGLQHVRAMSVLSAIRRCRDEQYEEDRSSPLRLLILHSRRCLASCRCRGNWIPSLLLAFDPRTSSSYLLKPTIFSKYRLARFTTPPACQRLICLKRPKTHTSTASCLQSGPV